MQQLPTSLGREPALTRIVVVDDHPWVRRGLVALLSTENQYQICGEAEDGPTAIALVESCKPDLAIVDISIKGSMDGIELTKILKASHPDLIILTLSLHAESQYGARAYAAGASAYLCKSSVNDSLFDTLDRLLKEKSV